MKHIADYLQEAFAERAAICEFDGGMSREQAEHMAQAEVDQRQALAGKVAHGRQS